MSTVVVLPLAVAAAVLSQRPWFPTLDMAMTELRVRDVGTRRTPLIGLPGRIGNFPDQGSHPGPASFYLVKPFHLLTGGRSWGLELGSAAVNSIAAVLAVLIARRVAGRNAMLGVGVVLAVAIRGYGLSVLTHPWNPYFPLLLWILIMVSTWGVLCGHPRLIVVSVVAGSVAAQTHVPYLLLAVSMCSLGLSSLIWRWWSDRRAIASVQPSTAVDEEVGTEAVGAAGPRFGQAALIGLGAAVAMWLPPIIDQLRREPGNISMLIEHFTGETDEAAVGFGTGATILLRHLDLPRAAWRLLVDDQAFVELSGGTGGPALGGVLVLALFAASGVTARRLRHVTLVNLHVVVALGLIVGWFSMSRIFGKVWYYLTLWAWGTSLLLAIAVAATFSAAIRDRWDRRVPAVTDDRPAPRSGSRLWIPAAGASSVAIATLLSLTAAPTLEVPESFLSDGLGDTLDATVDAVRSGVGDAVGEDGRYVVFWQDANFIGAQGYGLVNELERRGLDVGVHPTWRVPVTPYRVMETGTYDAEIHIVSDQYADEWRGRPGYVEVVVADPRSPEEVAEFDLLRREAIAVLDAAGRDDLVERLDVNLFGTAIDPTLPVEALDELERMLVLTTPVTVFIAPPDSTF